MPNRMNPATNIRDKDFDGLAWSKNNDDSFKQLVAQARAKRGVKKETEEPPKPEPVGELAASSMSNPEASTYISPYQSATTEFRPTGDDAAVDALLARSLGQPISNIIPASPPDIASPRFFEDAPPSSQQLKMQIPDSGAGRFEIHR